MKGIILAGGTGTRLKPLTEITNKHLLPIGKVPMIFYPLEKMVSSGIKEILIVTGTEHMGNIVTLLGSGKRFGCELTYRVQDEAGGIAQALAIGRNFVGNDPFLVILGDNIFLDSLAEPVKSFIKEPKGAMVMLKEVPDPHRFGVAEVRDNKIISIEEKPHTPKSNLAVAGIYFYDNQAFEIVKSLKPSARGELEVTDLNNWYLQNNLLHFSKLEGFWTDAGTFPSLVKASDLVAQHDYYPYFEEK